MSKFNFTTILAAIGFKAKRQPEAQEAAAEVLVLEAPKPAAKKSTGFVIEKNVVVRKPVRKRRCKYPFHTMEVGDSFIAKAEGYPGTNSYAATCAYAFAKRHGWKFKCSSRDGGKKVRIWRIA